MLAFVHLSDIHFHKFSSDSFDLDDDLRNEILLDIQDEYPKYINSATGILVCGDIAFSGKRDEYRVATSFLNDILERLSLKETDVYCVPGNHDVDQSVPKKEPAVYCLQKMLEEQKNHDSYDAKIAEIFRAEISSNTLYSPIDCYNTNFAAQYSCNFTIDKPYWENSLKLNDNYELSIWGLNSTIISNSDDHKDKKTERKMRLSRLQMPKRKMSTIFMTMCHHPPECWNDPNEELANLLNQRVMVQLYGHKHLQSIVVKENSIIVGSGAAHPSRKELEWIPRYNWITLDIKDDECLIIRIYPRIWNKEKSKFERDELNCENHRVTGNVFSEYTLKIASEDCKFKEQLLENKSQKEVDNSWKREFVYDFINLSFVIRCSILEKFELSIPEDEGKKHTDIITDIIQRAESKKCVQVLVNDIKEKKEAYRYEQKF